jgi:membrane-associated phospholipid phosphatase
MGFADIEQWLGVAVVVVWLLVAAASVAGRLPRVGRLRRATLVGTGVAAGLCALQASVVDAVADPGGVSAADPPTLAWFVAHRSPAATAVFQALAVLGGTAGMTALAAVTAGVLLVRHRSRAAVVVAVAAAGAELIDGALKDLYRRPRPPEITRLGPETNFSLPSGHALVSTAVVGVVAAAVVVAVRRRSARIAVLAVAAVTVVGIGLCRLYLGVHWLTDVLDGWLVGGSWLALCVTVLVRAAAPATSSRVP